MTLAAIAGVMISYLHRLDETVAKIETAITQDKLEKLPGLRRFLHPNLDIVIGSHVSDMLEQLSRIFRDRTYELDDIEMYRGMYKKTLEAYKGAHFLATSIPSEQFFWRTQSSTEQAISAFIKSGGRMSRIFFLSSYDDLRGEEARRILLTQCEAGVQVYTALLAGVPSHLRRFFLVDAEGRIGWEPVRGPDNTINGITMTADAEATTSYLRMFRELMNLDSTKPYMDSGYFIDPHTNTLQPRRLTMSPAVQIDSGAFRDFEHQGWEASVAAYDKHFGPLTQLMIGPLLDGAKVTNGMKVLDVATGPGYVAAAAAKRGAFVIGVDFSEKMIIRARAANGGQNLRFEIGDAEALQYEADSFDAVVMNFGILHLAQPEKAFQEAKRVLRSGGSFGFTVWAKPEEAEGFAIILRAIEVFGNANAPLPIGPPFFRFSDPLECESTLEKTGFVDTTSVKIPLVWRIKSADDVFTAFYEGTARTGGLLRAQSSDGISAIKDGVRKHCDKYLQGDKLSIPMPALVVTARKL
jgi:SAM-dependent methyltransferase